MEVLILSKTKYGQSQYCIGGITLIDFKFIRLLNSGGYYQPIDTELNIGDIWDITFSPSTNIKAPHNEDVIVNSKTFVKHIYDLKTYIKSIGIKIWKGSVYNIFDGHLKWTGSGSGYLSENQLNLPDNSVGFWIPDEDLIYDNGYYYIGNKKLNYKGATNPKPTIPKDSLVRLSLAKWWCPDGFYESRCYLQLSGVYQDKPKPITVEKPIVKNLDIENLLKSIEKPKPINYNAPLSRSTYTSTNTNSKNTSGGCYIATVCYGSYYANEVCDFRDFRDNTLNNYSLGKKFIKLYYRYSPAVSDKIKPYKNLNKSIRVLILSPLLKIIKILKLNKKKHHNIVYKK
ncbi:CFI-box-CTERM domain-containing protein [Myroides marinus]|uniref:CFI-box-CTERM domain-containing protein n=1 Tax=Myroides marinus TaxID=703342 RepID=UPI0025756AA5|nr:CFI-box-CTERM domain-containing protein [Myroides marinus]MDM1370281.1 hypothetical protein [Myroides marinus]MDM1383836.1 hypothetical protein [Myroides marinus]